jgi:hypothetical protein
MNYLERAQKGVDDLKAIIARLNEKPVGVDAPIQGAKIGNQTSVNGVPLVFIQKTEEVVADILLHVGALDAPVQDGIAGWAPEWWQQAKRIASDQGSEDGDATRFADAVATLDRHASDETVGLLCIAFLVDGLELHLMKSNQPPGFRSYSEPNPNWVDFVFHFHIDADEPDPIGELASDIPELQNSCVSFFRSVLSELID